MSRYVPAAFTVAACVLLSSGCSRHRVCCPPAAPVYRPAVVVPTQAFYPGQPARPPEGINALPAPFPPGAPPATGPWQPAPGFQPHVTETRPTPAPSPRLMPPEEPEPLPVRPVEPGQRPPDMGELPPDVPSFNIVYDKVASGLQPFPDGFAWLKERGYRTVLHIRAAGEDNAAARTNVLGHGLKYLSLEVSAGKLNRELVQEFSKIVRDSEGQPLFVYDRKGMLAGSLWYLHFRLTDNLPEAEARKRAVQLGLKEDTSGEYAELWLAINQFLRGS